MKKIIKIIITISQLIAIFLYAGIFKLIVTYKSETDYSKLLTILIISAIIAQSINFFLNKKFPVEFNDTGETLTKPRNNYWLVLILAIVAIMAGGIIALFFS